MKRKALGKGLSALLPESPKGETAATDAVGVVEIPLSKVDPNPDQPRQTLDEETLQALADSLKQQGVIQPILVRRTRGRYQIVAGERRFRAAGLAGLETVPAIVRDVSDRDALEIALIENIQREELNPIEEAAAYQRLITEHGYTQDSVAERVAKDRSTVSNTLRLLRLPKDLRRMVARGEISPGHARPLLSLPNASSQIELAQEIVAGELNVRSVERRVRQIIEPARPKPPKKTDANTRRAERKLETALGTKVKIHRSKKGGRIEIEFHNEESLHTVYNQLVHSRPARSK